MRNRANIITIVIIAFLSASLTLQSQERPSNFIIKAGAGANGNMYSSSFTQLPGYPSCCTKYANAFGFGGSAWAGAEYDIIQPFAGGRWRIELATGYTGLSAGFSQQEEIGNLITGNEVSKANVEYKIDPSISAIFVDQGFIYYPFEEMPLGIKVGFQVDFITGKTFTQEASLVNPGNNTFKNGKTTTEEYSGNLPDAAGQLFFATIGLRYEMYKWGNFSLVPEMQLNYGLNNVVTSLKWKASSVRAGLTLNYRVPRPSLPPPPPAPAAPLPEPPAEKPLVVSIGISAGNEMLKDMDTVYVTERQVLYINKYPVLPVAYYQKDSKLSQSGYSKAPDAESAQSMSLNSVVAYMKQNPTVKAKAYYSGLDDESEEMHAARIAALGEMLAQSGIEAGRITTEKSITAISDLKVKERADEYRSIRFEFSDNSKLLYVYGDTVRNSKFDNTDLKVEPKIVADAGPVNINGTVSRDGVKVYDMKPEPAVYAVNGDFVKPSGTGEILSIDLNARDAEGKENSSKVELVIKPKVVTEKVYENLTATGGEAKTSQYVLGYNSFDKADLEVIDREVLDKARAALTKGDTVVILPLTDNLGTKEYNEKLAKARLSAAIKLLGANEKNIEVVMPDNYLFTNEKPEGRMLNRCVVVRINNR